MDSLPGPSHASADKILSMADINDLIEEKQSSEEMEKVLTYEMEGESSIVCVGNLRKKRKKQIGREQYALHQQISKFKKAYEEGDRDHKSKLKKIEAIVMKALEDTKHDLVLCQNARVSNLPFLLNNMIRTTKGTIKKCKKLFGTNVPVVPSSTVSIDDRPPTPGNSIFPDETNQVPQSPTQQKGELQVRPLELKNEPIVISDEIDIKVEDTSGSSSY